MNWLGVAARNLLRNKTRTAMTILGVSVALLTFTILRTVISAWTVAEKYGARDRIATRHKVTFIMTLPKRYMQKIRAIPGVTHATWANWFGAKHPIRESEFFASMAVDGKSWFQVYDDLAVDADQLEAFQQDRQGAVVGDALAAKFGWKVGDRITLRGTIFPGTWQFHVRGIYRATRRSAERTWFLFHWSYLNESLPQQQRDQIGWVVSRVANAGQSADVSKAIDTTFDSSDIQTTTMTEREMNMSFLGMISALLRAVDVVSLVIVAIMGLILGNTIAMGVRERTHEYGVLRALGFRAHHIAGLVVGESMTISLLGAALGLSLSYPLVDRGIGRFIEENLGAFFPYFRIASSTVIATVLIAAVLGPLAAAVPAYRASKLRVVDALRRVG